jgi:tRNA uridine 5-carboxymethylaminomethyl modification enzyme
METQNFDVVVVGAGHAGCEAALACARKGHKTLMATVSLENIAFLACNPSVGGTAKGQLVREVDALGGEIGLCADETALQYKMLNTAKGAAVQSLRAQCDKFFYHTAMKRRVENQENLYMRGVEVVSVEEKNGRVCGVRTSLGEEISARAVVLACGVYLSSDVIIGEFRRSGGPSGFAPANSLSACLTALGMRLLRFKTGTPARADGRTVNFSAMQKQPGDESVYPFSFLNERSSSPQRPCYLTYTNQATHDLIRANLHRAPMYTGLIKGVGPRYCPSIEDKVVRFSDKARHQVFIEPEGAQTNEVYIQGVSTSLPADVQLPLYRTIAGLEKVELTRYAYAIEYDCIDSRQLELTLRCGHIEGLYFAGQINGSSGYEEAAAQGLVAGVNAALYLENRPPFVLTRQESYIGVLVDDLVTKGTEEPYRMMTARAEHRIYLRQDNADIRLTEKGRAIGLVSDERWAKFLRRAADTEELLALLQTVALPKVYAPLFDGREEKPAGGLSLRELLKRPEITARELKTIFPALEKYGDFLLAYAEAEIKYEGDLKKEKQQIEKALKFEEAALPQDMDYKAIKGLRLEAAAKLDKRRPKTVGQASRISGVSPADITVLLLALKRGREPKPV